jgi:hypothetical protein
MAWNGSPAGATLESTWNALAARYTLTANAMSNIGAYCRQTLNSL